MKIDIRELGSRVIINCPYCKTDQIAGANCPFYVHNCDDAGLLFIMNGHIFVDVPGYLKEEIATTYNH
jgi:hypothetical protein